MTMNQEWVQHFPLGIGLLTETEALYFWLQKQKRELLSSTWSENFQMFKLGLEKAEEPEIKLPASAGS